MSRNNAGQRVPVPDVIGWSDPRSSKIGESLQGDRMKRIAMVFAAGALAGLAALPAAADEALAKKHNCFACHALDKKVVCPAAKDVANKFVGGIPAETKL